MIDLKFTQDSLGNWHLDTANGDLALTNSLDTAVYMSLLGEKRASKSQVNEPTLRRGHFSNEYNDVENYEVGCLFWLYTSQQPLTDQIITSINESVKKGLQWMIDDKIITKVESSATKSGTGVTIEVELINSLESNSKYYNLFVNLIN